MRVENAHIIISEDDPFNHLLCYIVFVDCVVEVRSTSKELPILTSCAWERCQFNITSEEFFNTTFQSYVEDCTFAEDQSNG